MLMNELEDAYRGAEEAQQVPTLTAPSKPARAPRTRARRTVARARAHRVHARARAGPRGDAPLGPPLYLPVTSPASHLHLGCISAQVHEAVHLSEAAYASEDAVRRAAFARRVPPEPTEGAAGSVKICVHAPHACIHTCISSCVWHVHGVYYR